MGIAKTVQGLVTGQVPVRFTAYDGSVAGPADAAVGFEVRSERALSYLVTGRHELGLARAYVSGDLEVHGDMYAALTAVNGLRLDQSWSGRYRALRDLGGLRLLNPPPRPPMEARLRGRRHSKERDQAAISHHYDVSNRFYEWLLGPSMAYTCAVFPDAAATLEQAQFAKHDLVARKLDLRPGMRLLDVGCGWGGMVMHAAREYGVKALGVTLSRRQAEWAAKAIADAGLSDLAEVRHMDYRDVPVNHYDAISSIGLTEHIGRAQLPGYFRFLQQRLRFGGRLLNHCITRPDNRDPGRYRRTFINQYVFPDGELEGVGHLIGVMNENGFEVRHEENLREHYALTLARWSANLERHWAESVREIGQSRARVWRLYLAGCRLGFERDQVQLHQVLGVRLDPNGGSGMPLRPSWT
ncbi:cyclopropane-fatty-acyl-phospholipid synthase family protein [Catellatospora methionotrophica]|uniref:cyclopropane-fatty-acyl-phospholipid synthase family protein n=1 Tax=Catellatospora methionotrophica TaxID=121620 RepID=UPI0033D89DF8